MSLQHDTITWKHVSKGVWFNIGGRTLVALKFPPFKGMPQKGRLKIAIALAHQGHFHQFFDQNISTNSERIGTGIFHLTALPI